MVELTRLRMEEPTLEPLGQHPLAEDGLSMKKLRPRAPIRLGPHRARACGRGSMLEPAVAADQVKAEIVDAERLFGPLAIASFLRFLPSQPSQRCVDGRSRCARNPS